MRLVFWIQKFLWQNFGLREKAKYILRGATLPVLFVFSPVCAFSFRRRRWWWCVRVACWCRCGRSTRWWSPRRGTPGTRSEVRGSCLWTCNPLVPSPGVKSYVYCTNFNIWLWFSASWILHLRAVHGCTFWEIWRLMNRAWEPFFIAFDMGNTVGLFRGKLWVDIQLFMMPQSSYYGKTKASVWLKGVILDWTRACYISSIVMNRWQQHQYMYFEVIS